MEDSELRALQSMIEKYKVVDSGKKGRVVVDDILIHDYIDLFAEYQKLVIEKNNIEDKYYTLYERLKNKNEIL